MDETLWNEDNEDSKNAKGVLRQWVTTLKNLEVNYKNWKNVDGGDSMFGKAKQPFFAYTNIDAQHIFGAPWKYQSLLRPCNVTPHEATFFTIFQIAYGNLSDPVMDLN